MIRMCRKNRPPREEVDRNITIAPMNVEGMPWHAPVGPGRFKKFKNGTRQSPGNEHPGGQNNGEPPMTAKETRNLIFTSVLAALVIALIFMGVIFLFILFCLYVWFR